MTAQIQGSKKQIALMLQNIWYNGLIFILSAVSFIMLIGEFLNWLVACRILIENLIFI